jgi:cell division protease FtsH
MTRSDISDAISHQIDQAVRKMVKLCYVETVQLVKQHREAMDTLVEILIEKETIDGDEFRSIVNEFASIPEKERSIALLNTQDQ